jgi:hypothetical protein
MNKMKLRLTLNDKVTLHDSLASVQEELESDGESADNFDLKFYEGSLIVINDDQIEVGTIETITEA